MKKIFFLIFAIISLLSKNSLRDLLSNPASALRNSPLCSIPALGLPIAIICPLLSHKKKLFVVTDFFFCLIDLTIFAESYRLYSIYRSSNRHFAKRFLLFQNSSQLEVLSIVPLFLTS